MKKGFTLIELLAVIIVLGLLAILVVPSVINQLARNKDKTSEVTKQLIFSGADLYEQNNHMPIYNGSVNCVTLQQIVDSGYLEDPIIDGMSGNKIDLNLFVEIQHTYNYDLSQYYAEYNLVKNCTPTTPQILCKAVTKSTKTAGNVPKTGKFEPGDEYICEVGPNMKYHFFTVSTEEDKVNLLMDSNINEKGELVNNDTITDKGLVSWIKKEDYLTAGGEENDWYVSDSLINQNGRGEFGNVTKGPITAINYLNEATKNWSYIPNMDVTYSDQANPVVSEVRYEIKLNGKARLLNYEESLCLFETDDGCPRWMTTNLDSLNTGTDDTGETIYLGEDGKVYGYWTMVTYSGKDGKNIKDVYDADYSGIDTDFNYYVDGQIRTTDGVAMDYFCGVRPVISINKINILN